MKVNVERADVKEWIDLISASRAAGKSAKVWDRVYHLVNVPSRRRVSVNLYKINKFTNEGDNVAVPGKVLSVGSMDHKVNITAIEFSQEALTRLREAGCTIVDIREMLASKKVSVII
jgi:large subunit ribosomal protein L18e